MHKKVFWSGAVLLALLYVGPARAWEAVFPRGADVPQRYILVDKQTPRLFLVADGTMILDVFCASGLLPGDKWKESDMHTPEGVYFVTGHIPRGLDFMEYGGSAWRLNYPNPVDRLRGKTGSNIWLHSRGRALVARESRGCVVLSLHDFSRLGALETGLPVIIGEGVAKEKTSPVVRTTEHHGENGVGSAEPLGEPLSDEAKRLTEHWSELRARGSGALLDLYWPSAYASAQRLSFGVFRNAFEDRLLAGERGRRTGAVHVLAGDGYAVSWFPEQVYCVGKSQQRSGQEGIRRLYWMPDPEGRLRIVGEEWVVR